MRSIKLLAILSLGVLIYSCGTKKVATTTPIVSQNTQNIKTFEMTPELAEGKTLYESNCNKCHKLFEPASRSKEKWGLIINRMAPKAKLTDAQKTLVYNYIVAGL